MPCTRILSGVLKTIQCFDGPSDEFKPMIGSETHRQIHPQARVSIGKDPKALRTESFKKGGSLKSPDRFLPMRRLTLDSAIDSFRANKDPITLTSDERLVRNKYASVDSFSQRRRVSSPIPLGNKPRQARTFSGNRNGGGKALH